MGSGIDASPVLPVGSEITCGAGIVPASSDVVSSTEYANFKLGASDVHQGSNEATTAGVEPGAK